MTFPFSLITKYSLHDAFEVQLSKNKSKISLQISYTTWYTILTGDITLLDLQLSCYLDQMVVDHYVLQNLPTMKLIRSFVQDYVSLFNCLTSLCGYTNTDYLAIEATVITSYFFGIVSLSLPWLHSIKSKQLPQRFPKKKQQVENVLDPLYITISSSILFLQSSLFFLFVQMATLLECMLIFIFITFCSLNLITSHVMIPQITWPFSKFSK